MSLLPPRLARLPRRSQSACSWTPALLISIAGVVVACKGEPTSASSRGAPIPAAVINSSVPESPATVAVREPEPPDPTAQIPWISSVRERCARYKAAPNDIKRSQIFNEVKAMQQRAAIKDVKGQLLRLSTNRGGGELTLTIKVGDVEFTTDTLVSPIRSGSPVYNAAAEMSSGQCVVFSASRLHAGSMVGESQVCDLGYFADITSLAPCS